jgi:uroporphyrinogen-III decarboxylase
LHSPSEVEHRKQPDTRKQRLLPFVIKRCKHLQLEIEKAGHKIRFAVARGLFDIASFPMGVPEFSEASASLLETAGFNLLNFGMQYKLTEMKARTNNRIALMGNIPPSDVLAEGTSADVKRSVRRC